MKLLPDIGYPQTGEKAEPGNYACMNCDHTAENDNSVINLSKPSKLPDCPVCGYTYWMKI
jgi:DNA-directed RNA polymerase subunit RPC12/RpoP